MKDDQPLHVGARKNALWGRGSKRTSRAAAPGWHRRGAVVLGALATALLLPLGASAATHNWSNWGQQAPTNSQTQTSSQGSSSSSWHFTTPKTGFPSFPSGSWSQTSSTTGSSGSTSGSSTTPTTGTSGSTSSSSGSWSWGPSGQPDPTKIINKADSLLNQTGTALPWKSTTSYDKGSFLHHAQSAPNSTYRVIVQVGSKPLENAVSGWARRFGGAHDFSLINGASLQLPGWAVLFINEHPNLFGGVTVTKDEPLYTVGTTADTAPNNGTEMDYQKAIGANALWSHPAVSCPVDSTGQQIDPSCQPVPAYTAPQAPAIAIVDTGIDPTKAADFGARIVASVDFSSLSPAGATGDQMGHGTMVAGIAAGASSYAPGVAQNAPLVDVRTGDAQGESMTSDVIDGLDWVYANRAKYDIGVVNLSMVGNQATSFQTDPLDKAVEKLWLNGIVVVTAVGNNGNADGTPSAIGAPANDPFVITVGALDQAGTTTPSDDTRAPWSAFGHTVDGFQKPEISAPGRWIVAPVPADSTLAQTAPDRVTAPGYMWMSGTSLAAPQVAGAAADILALHPTWTPDQVKGALMVTATKTAAAGASAGVGELNAVAAAEAVANPPNPNLNLYQFVSQDPTTGLNVMNGSAWEAYAKANPTWTPSDYSSTDWAVTDWAVTDWAVTDWAVTDWAVTDWAVTDWAVTDWAVTDWAVTDWAVTDWAVTDWAVTDWAVTDWAVTDWAVTNPSE